MAVLAKPVQSDSYDDDENRKDNDGTISPVFDDEYFENNPEEGNSRWGWQIDACNDEKGCIVNDNVDSPGAPGPPAHPPGNPGGTCEPVAPTAATPNVAEAVTALNGGLGVNPDARGLTGLETWLWVADPPGEISWTQAGTPGIDEDCSELPAPTTTFTATVDSWTFHIDGEHDSATYTSDTPGTEDDPAATHVFDYVGTYQLELTADLRGAVTTRVPVDQRDYDVVEIRSRLTE